MNHCEFFLIFLQIVCLSDDKILPLHRFFNDLSKNDVIHSQV
jgi:hypothetical protein